MKKTQWLKGVPASYGPATGDRRCPGCLEYEDGFCRLHDQVVEDDHMCEDWNDMEDWRAEGEPEGTAQKALEPEPALEDWRAGDDHHAGGKRPLPDAIEGGETVEKQAADGETEEATMPYEKRQQGDQWCVFKEGESEPLKCYDAEGEADDYLTALRINVEAEEKQAPLEEPESQARAILRQAVKEALAESEAEKQQLTDELAALKAELEAERTAKATPKKTEEDGKHPVGHYLVVEDPEKPSTWHLRVKNADGDLDHRLMGAAWAALTVGYRGNKYQGPDKQKAIAKLKRLYESEGLDTPGEKAMADEGAIGGKARGEGQGQGNEPQGDAGTDTCICPKCGYKAEHERGTPCNETQCPECGAAMARAEEKGQGDTAGDTKAGARLKRSMRGVGPSSLLQPRHRASRTI